MGLEGLFFFKGERGGCFVSVFVLFWALVLVFF